VRPERVVGEASHVETFTMSRCFNCPHSCFWDVVMSVGQGARWPCPHMERIEKTVFLSYRKTNAPWALGAGHLP